MDIEENSASKSEESVVLTQPIRQVAKPIQAILFMLLHCIFGSNEAILVPKALLLLLSEPPLSTINSQLSTRFALPNLPEPLCATFHRRPAHFASPARWLSFSRPHPLDCETKP